jgi:hypothetical protein
MTKCVVDETFTVVNVKGVTGNRNHIPFVCNLSREEFTSVEWSAKEVVRCRYEYDRFQLTTADGYDTEAALRKAMGDDYNPPEIPRSRVLETSRQTTMSKKSASYDTTLTIESSEEEKWRRGILETFGKKPVYFNFVDGLYMLLKRPQQPYRVQLVIPNYFQADDRVYVGSEQFKVARSATAKCLGLDVRALPDATACRILRFQQVGHQPVVTISDFEMYKEENEGFRASRGRQLILNQCLATEKPDRGNIACAG